VLCRTDRVQSSKLSTVLLLKESQDGVEIWRGNVLSVDIEKDVS
jgi:hypothetical protein